MKCILPSHFFVFSNGVPNNATQTHSIFIKNHGPKNSSPGCNLGPKFSTLGWSLVRKKWRLIIRYIRLYKIGSFLHPRKGHARYGRSDSTPRLLTLTHTKNHPIFRKHFKLNHPDETYDKTKVVKTLEKIQDTPIKEVRKPKSVRMILPSTGDFQCPECVLSFPTENLKVRSCLYWTILTLNVPVRFIDTFYGYNF